MMNITRSQRTVAFVLAAALGLGAAVSGQVAQPSAPPRTQTQMDELLAEVRAIRADLDRAAAASMRGQLLGMRLQLQEQRIAAVSRQLSEVQQRLRENAGARLTLQGSVKMFASMTGADSKPEEAAQMKLLFGPLKQQLAALDASDGELKAEESQLTAQLHDEQNRWTAFNAQIEEMERASAGRIR